MAINLGGADLPKQWVISKLPEFTDVVMGQSPPSDTYNLDSIGLPFFQGKSEFGAIYPTINKYCSVPNRIADEGATLLSVRAPVGPTNLANTRCCIGRGLAAIHPMGGMDSMFILLLFRSIEINLSGEGTGTTFKAITKAYVDELKFAIPPLNEQKRIVAKIEELFSELDNGIAALKTAREQLKVYRQAVLKHAFEGKLTAQWRKDNADKLESPEQLLARIQQEREARHQQQLDEWRAAVKAWEEDGKEGRKPNKPKAPEQASLEEIELQLPSNWTATRLGFISEVSGGLTKNQKRNALPLKMKYLRVANVYADRLLLDDVQEIGVTEAEAKKISLVLNDLLVVEGNGSVEQIGRVSLWDASIQHCGHQNHLIRVRLDNPDYARFVLLFLLSPIGRELIVKEASSTSGLHTLSISKVSNLQVPLCSLPEASEVMKIVDEKLTLTEKFENEIETELQRAETLRQSILKKAFSGQLAPQDPNDEPASELLARIQAEKATKKAEPKAAAKPKAVRKPRAKRSTQSTEATP